MNEELILREEPVAETPQCEAPIPAYVGRELTEMNKVRSCESKEQREQSRKIEFLKNWEIIIQVLDRGCIVKVGCKSIAFVSVEAGYKEIGRYLENPRLVATEHGFGEHLS